MLIQTFPAFSFAAIGNCRMEEANIRDLGSKMASGEISARSLAESYLQRIEVMDRSGPSLNSIIELNPDALAIAGERDRERAAGQAERTSAWHSDPHQGQHRH